MTIHSVFIHISSGLILVEFISNPSINDRCNHSMTGNSSLLQIKETMAVKLRCFAVSKQVNSDTYTNSHTNMHLSRTQEDEVLLKLLSDPQSEMDAGIKKKKKGKVTLNALGLLSGLILPSHTHTRSVCHLLDEAVTPLDVPPLLAVLLFL